MTPTRVLQDEILELEAKLHGKRLELAMAQGDRAAAQAHLVAMKASVKARGELRVAIEVSAGGCYFDSRGAADAMALREIRHG